MKGNRLIYCFFFKNHSQFLAKLLISTFISIEIHHSLLCRQILPKFLTLFYFEYVFGGS